MSVSIARSINNQAVSQPWQRRLAAIFEVCGVYMVGLLIAYGLTLVLGLKLVNPLQALAADPGLDLLELSKDMALVLLIQYGGILPLAFLVGWWHRRRKLASYGLTTAGKPIGYHLLAGILLFAVSDLPGKLMIMIDQIVPLGQKPAFQEIVFNVLNWSDYRLWILMAVGSFLLVPVVEELFFQGYVQTRLGEGFGAPAAILMTAFFFSFSHSQYLVLSAWNIGMVVTSLFEALIWGYAFYRTRSLIPLMIAHALVNTPLRGLADFGMPVLMLGFAIAFRNQIGAEFRQFGALLRLELSSRAATMLGILFATAFAILVGISQDVALLLGIVLMIVAVVLELVEKRRQKQALQVASAA